VGVRRYLPVMDELSSGCWCVEVSCSHVGFRCGKPVAHTVRASDLLELQDCGPERELGICQGCWANAQKILPKWFKAKGKTLFPRTGLRCSRSNRALFVRSSTWP
jgi:hypothetical protein